MHDALAFGLVVLCGSAAGLLPVQSHLLSERVRVPAPAFFLVAVHVVTGLHEPPAVGGTVLGSPGVYVVGTGVAGEVDREERHGDARARESTYDRHERYAAAGVELSTCRWRGCAGTRTRRLRTCWRARRAAPPRTACA